MEAEACAETEVFISKDHQIVLAREDDIISVETRLTKGDAAPPQALPNSDELSDITGSTRESKAKAYADKAVKEVAAQYTNTISDMQGDLGAKDDKIAQLQLLIEQMQNSTDNLNPNTTTDDSSSPSKKIKTSAMSSLADDDPL